jgi:hypothetical protein
MEPVCLQKFKKWVQASGGGRGGGREGVLDMNWLIICIKVNGEYLFSSGD